MALSANRSTAMRAGDDYSYPCAAAKQFYEGAIVVLDTSGNAEPATVATGKIVVGISQKEMLSTTAAAEEIPVKAGVAHLKNSGTNTLTKANIGDTVYAEDDETVGSLATGMSAVGRMVDIDSTGVWVDVQPFIISGLAAANNLSDVASVATARSSLGLDTGDSPTFTDVTTTDDVTVGDDLNVTGLATIGETLVVTGLASFTAGILPGPATKVLVKAKKTTLTAAQIKALATTAIECVAAVANKMLVPIAAFYKFTAGSEILVEPSAPDDIALRWVDATGHIISEEADAGVLMCSAGPVDAYAYALGVFQEGVLAEAVNVPIVVHNTGANWTGNASADCALDVWILYAEIDMS